jgi:hypothetical protein
MPASVAIRRILRRAASRKVTRAINKVVRKAPSPRERVTGDGSAVARPIICWLFAGGSGVPAATRRRLRSRSQARVRSHHLQKEIFKVCTLRDDREAYTKAFERRFETLDGIVLLAVVERFIVDAGDAQHHAQVAGLRQECSLVPETEEVDVRVQGIRFPLRFDDSIQTQHQWTSTLGICCLAAS